MTSYSILSSTAIEYNAKSLQYFGCFIEGGAVGVYGGVRMHQFGKMCLRVQLK